MSSLDSKRKKVAVIGGGLAGIISTVNLIEEGCFDIICFEKTDRPGGTWNYREETEIGIASIMPTTIINHSKEMGAMSNFPPKKESSNFMKHHELFSYIMDYAERWGALEHFRYNTEVIRVKKSEDYEETGRWGVTVKNVVTGENSTDVYEGVLVCIGQFNIPKMPSFPGQDEFKGRITHTHSLKGVDQYRGKNVVIVGMGCSGLDAAVDISLAANKVYLSTRSGSHVISRVGKYGLPIDFVLLRRFYIMLMDILPFHWVSWLLETCTTEPHFDPKLYNIPPKHPVLAKEPVLNDHFGSKLLSGSIIQKPDVDRITEEGVIFTGDSDVTRADVIIMATGYAWQFPFLEKNTIKSEDGKFNLYKCMYPSHLPHGTLAIIGLILPFGPSFPAGELQARWAVQVFAGKCRLPSQEEMNKDIDKKFEVSLVRYVHHDKLSQHIEVLPYCDELASQIGAKPNFMKLLLTDPYLLYKLCFGPSLPYQYRLEGPHSWNGAREAIMTSKYRLLYPLRKFDKTKYKKSNAFICLLKKIVRFFTD